MSWVPSNYHILLQEEKKDAFFLIVAVLTWTIRLRIPSSITNTSIVVASTMSNAILFVIITRYNWKITINQHTWLTRTQSYPASKGPIILLWYAWGACAGCIQAKPIFSCLLSEDQNYSRKNWTQGLVCAPNIQWLQLALSNANAKKRQAFDKSVTIWH